MLPIKAAGSSTARYRSGCVLQHAIHDAPLGESSRSPHRRTYAARSDTYTPPTSRRAKPQQRIKNKAVSKSAAFARQLKQASFAGTSQNPLEPISSRPVSVPGTPPPRSLDDDGSDPSDTHKEATVQSQIAEILADPPPPTSPVDHIGNPVYDQIVARRVETEYRRRYQEAFKRIDAAFIRRQLVVEASGLPSSKSLTKPFLIQALMNNAGWPVPGAKKKKDEDEENRAPTERKALDLPENVLFLLLRDTKLVHDLMMNQGIYFSVVPALDGEGNPTERTVLTAEGEPAQIQKLQRTLEARGQYMTVVPVNIDVFEGFMPPWGLVQLVSAVTGCHLAYHTPTELRISTMSPAKATLAQRLLQVAALRGSALPALRRRSILAPPAGQQTETEKTDLFSVLPFFSSPSALMPWENLREGYGEMLYRMRKVRDWSARSGDQEAIHRDEPLEGGKLFLHGGSAEVDLKTYVADLVAAVEKEKILTVRFGHLLLRHRDGVQGGLLSSPIPGQWPLTEAQNRFQDTARPVFSPSVTPAMIRHSLDTTAVHHRRLMYRSSDGKTQLTFTYAYPPVERKTPATSYKTNEETEHWLTRLNAMVAEMDKEEKEFERRLTRENADRPDQEVAADEASIDPSAEAQPAAPPMVIQVEKSDLTEFDVMMPDRPVDAQFIVASSEAVPSVDIPSAIHDFFSIQHHPTDDAVKPRDTRLSAPDAITFAEETYTLERDEDVNVTESKIADDEIVLRNIQTKDMILGVDRISSHSEIECRGAEIPDRFWREMATVSRDVAPGSGSLASDSTYAM